MPRWLRAGLCGLVAVGFLAGCSGVDAPVTMEPRGYGEKVTRAPLTFEMLVNALPPEAEGPLGLPYKDGCPDVTNDECVPDVIVTHSAARSWGHTGESELDAEWMRPFALIQLIEFPDVVGSAQRLDMARTGNSPRFQGAFDIAAIPKEEGHYWAGYRGEGSLEDAAIAAWTGFSGRADHTLTDLEAEASALYHSEVLTLRAGTFVIACHSADLAPNENGDVCLEVLTEMVGRVEEGR